MTQVVDKPLTARRAQTQERLMAAAVRMFAERGIIGASVEEICEAAGFTRGAFYSNFADKDELVLALIRKTLRTQVAAAEQAIARTLAAPPKLDTSDLVSFVLAAFVEFGNEDRETILVERELLLYAARQPALRAPYLAFVDECDRHLSHADLRRPGARRAGVHRGVRRRADAAEGDLAPRADEHHVRRRDEMGADAHPADGHHSADLHCRLTQHTERLVVSPGSGRLQVGTDRRLPTTPQGSPRSASRRRRASEARSGGGSWAS